MSDLDLNGVQWTNDLQYSVQIKLQKYITV